LTPDETDALLARSKQLLDDFNPDDHPLTKFTTSDKNHVGDEYFLTSGMMVPIEQPRIITIWPPGDKIRYFLEEGAVDETGKLIKEKHKSVNKIGHGELVKSHVTPMHG
jgi:phytanoyl-CoA hydroxylase